MALHNEGHNVAQPATTKYRATGVYVAVRADGRFTSAVYFFLHSKYGFRHPKHVDVDILLEAVSSLPGAFGIHGPEHNWDY